MQYADQQFIADLVAVMKRHNIATLEVRIDDRSDYEAIRHGEGMMYHEVGSYLLATDDAGTPYELAWSEYGDAVFNGEFAQDTGE